MKKQRHGALTISLALFRESRKSRRGKTDRQMQIARLFAMRLQRTTWADRV